MPEEQRTLFLHKYLPEDEFIPYYDLFSDFHCGGYRLLGDLIIDTDNENITQDRARLRFENDTPDSYALNALNMLHSICQQTWKTQQRSQDWKRSVFIPIPKKGNAKECSNYHTIALTSKVMLKILQARLQQYVNHGLPDVQAGFRKGGGTRDQIVNICWIMEKAREFQKNIYFCFIDYAKAFDCVITINCGKF